MCVFPQLIYFVLFNTRVNGKWKEEKIAVFFGKLVDCKNLKIKLNQKSGNVNEPIFLNGITEAENKKVF